MINLFSFNCLSFRSVLFSFIVLAISLNSLEANAVPSFARQTGMKCVMCHTAFPQLTPFGRNFKMNGYTLSAEQATFPPLAVMFQGYLGFTYTRKPQATGALPSNYHNNNNVSVNQASIFYAGRLLGPYGKKLFGDSIGNILNKVGVFAQATRDGIAHTWSWDNVEFRVAQTMNIANKSVVVGAYANNNPTMQDLWNSTPTWGFPFSDSGLAPGPVASPLIAGGVSQQVVGLGVYMMIDNQLYLDVGSYKTLSQGKQKALGVDPAGETEIDGNAPYWRIALEKTWGAHTMEIGTYGLNANTFLGRDKSAGHDRFLDIAVDLQYQWSTTGKDVTISANWINEYQTLDASKLLGLAQNRSNKLWTASLYGSYLIDKTYGFDAQYFKIGGDADPLFYGTATGGPNTDGWRFQLNYLPFNKNGGPKFLTSSSVKFALQYIMYNKFDGAKNNFDGTGRNASDNDTVYLQSWIVF